MQFFDNYPIITIALLFMIIHSLIDRNESFSTSGSAISNKYCTQLADVYYLPKITNNDSRIEYRKRICGKQKHQISKEYAGNYLTQNDMLM
jgi:hypothetical protein